jgi:FkbM family methyltransferase
MSGDLAVTRRISHAQNGEDVRVWRALRGIQDLFYVEVGASHPVVDSVTAALSAEGGRGLLVEADPDAADLLREGRPKDVVVAAAASSSSGVLTFHELDRRGWGTVAEARVAQAQEHVVRSFPMPAVRVDDLLADLAPAAVHFLCVDVEGHEAAVLAGAGLSRHRPWILCVEATLPQSRTPSWQQWEPEVLAAGYRFVTFDGLNRWYVAEERAELADAVAEPINVLDRLLDGWVPAEVVSLQERVRRGELEARNLQRIVLFVEGLLARAEGELERVLARAEAEAEQARVTLELERQHAQAAVQAEVEAAAAARRAEAEAARQQTAALQRRHAEELETERRRAAATTDAVRDELSARVAEAEARTAHLAGSRSWRYTRPMRELLHAVSSHRPGDVPGRTRAVALSAANRALTQRPELRAALLERLEKVPGATERLRTWQVPPAATGRPALALHQTADTRLRTAAGALIEHYATVRPTPRVR